MGKVNGTQEQVGSVHERWTSQERTKKKCQRNFLIENSAFGDLISRLDMAVERISELEDISTEACKTKKRTKT